MSQQDRHADFDMTLRRFTASLRPEIGAERILLFGSYPRGDARAESDVDVIVVGPSFRDVNPATRAVGLRRFWREAGGDVPMDIVCVTLEEFADATTAITLIAAVLPEAVDLLDAA